jgi:putative Mg2+ transporter-C (MgtC) family protein
VVETISTAGAGETDVRLVTVGLTPTAPGAIQAATALGTMDGVIRVDIGDDEED